MCVTRSLTHFYHFFQKNSESVQSSGRRPSSEAPSGPCSKISRLDNATSPVEDGSNSPTVGGSALTGALWTSIQCVYCNKILVSPDVSPRLMECLHSACESCITSRLEEKTQSGETNCKHINYNDFNNT